MTWANVLTAIRLVMLPPLVYAVLQQQWLAAAAYFTLAVVTDIYDGKLARQFKQTSPHGGLFDHATDALLVTLGSWAMAQLGLINPWLHWMIPLAFIQYMLDSKALAGASLRMSRLGKYNGIAYYALLGTGIGVNLLTLDILLVVVSWGGWLLVITTAMSMLDRAVTLRRTQKKQGAQEK